MNHLPNFPGVNPGAIVSELTEKLNANRQIVNDVLAKKDFTWRGLVQPLEDMDVSLSNYWAVISHLHNVVCTDDLRKAYEKCLPLLTEYSTELGLNKDLYQAYVSFKNSQEYKTLSIAQKKAVDNILRDFKLAGVALEGEAKKRYQEIQLKLTDLTNKYEQNVMDSTDAWEKLVTDPKQLQGIPDLAKEGFEQKAKEKQQKGWLITLDFPSYYSVITYADNRDLRKELYEAYCTRASDQWPHDNKFDNSNIMFEILQLRDEEAKLLNFASYAEYSLATKMAPDSEKVLSFLRELAEKTKAVALKEWQELQDFAKHDLHIEDFSAWDIAYASEKLRIKKHNISQEELRPYFEVTELIEGLFHVAAKLYNISIVQNIRVTDLWHKDVTYYDIYDADKKLIAGFYLDLFARPKKRGGAWMDECRVRHCNHQKDLQLPIAYLTCNFTAPLPNKPTLLTHDEVVTLFHEFGHGLHHMLTKINIASVAGINGVAWDAVEFPSQFMENWCWQKESLDMIACHYETKERMPEELLDKLKHSKNFQAGMQMLRQLEFALFDFRIHKEFNGENQIQKILNYVRDKIAVVKPPAFNRFQNSFTHIFGGGYAAGYYSYKWAEVLAADAFESFEHAGTFDPILGEKFKTSILEKGGSEDALELFKQFKGREPQVDALLRESEII